VGYSRQKIYYDPFSYPASALANGELHKQLLVVFLVLGLVVFLVLGLEVGLLLLGSKLFHWLESTNSNQLLQRLGQRP